MNDDQKDDDELEADDWKDHDQHADDQNDDDQQKHADDWKDDDQDEADDWDKRSGNRGNPGRPTNPHQGIQPLVTPLALLFLPLPPSPEVRIPKQEKQIIYNFSLF